MLATDAATPCDADPDPLVWLGHDEDFGDIAQAYPDIAFGHRVEIDAPTTLRRLAVITGGAGPELRLALYAGADGPAALVAQTPAFAAGFGRNEREVDPVPLAVGTYWVILHTSAPTLIHRTLDNDHETAFTPRPFGDGLPADGAAFEVIDDFAYNLYVGVAP